MASIATSGYRCIKRGDVPVIFTWIVLTMRVSWLRPCPALPYRASPCRTPPRHASYHLIQSCRVNSIGCKPCPLNVEVEGIEKAPPPSALPSPSLPPAGPPPG